MTDRIDKIMKLKKERRAVILAHFYQLPEVQDIADFVGDSLELARKAQETDAEVIVFCGVRFMAETAKILNPGKTVLLPAPDAGCPMADMVTAEDVRRLRAEHPGAAVMCYVNSDAGVKAESDICCTSSNAVRAAESLSEKEIIFVPDMNLGGYVAGLLPDRRFILPGGFCPTHMQVRGEDIKRAAEALPGARVLVHPECTEEVIRLADFVGSTSQIIAEAVRSEAREFIIGTEEGVLHRLGKLCPEKSFYNTARSQVCPNMKKTRLENVLYSLENLYFSVEVDAELSKKAFHSLDRMLKLPAPAKG